MNRGLTLQPPPPHGKRRQKREAQNQAHLGLVLDEAAMPPPHNASAPAIRMRTVFRKGPNGFGSDGGRARLAAVRAAVNTGQRQGLTASQASQTALSLSGALFEPG